MKEYLFVYGKLKHNQANEISEYLIKHSEFVGEGYVLGKLYNVGEYPGLIPSSENKEKVFGEIFELNALEIFQTLDKYEEAWPAYPDNAEFKRVVLEVHKNYKTILCWVYVFNRLPDESKRIISGIF